MVDIRNEFVGFLYRINEFLRSLIRSKIVREFGSGIIKSIVEFVING